MKRLFSLLFLLHAAAALAAPSITGTVTNQTTHKPSAGDDVVLIRLAQGMQESTRTTTDARGHFELTVPDDGIHLVRVTHQKASYFKPAPPGTQSLDIDVYNAAARVSGVSLDANVMRLQTEPDGKTLNVVENFFLKNESTPPVTQFSDRSFEFNLPEGAVVEGAAAQGTGGMTVQSPPVPLPEKGRYAFVFPIRPGGQTRFQISFKVPYNGALQLAPIATMATDNLVVMMPKSMKFDAGSASPFNHIAEEMDAQTYVVRGVAQGKTVAFTVSGAGQLPRPTTTPQDASQQDQGSGAPTGTPATGADPNADPGANTTPNRPGGGLADPIGSPDPLTKYKWWILGGLTLLLAGGAGFLLSRPQAPTAVAASVPGAAPPPAPGASLMQVLRDELFTLESERLTGRITQAEYDRVKPALEVVLQHALTRHSSGTGAQLEAQPPRTAAS